MHGAYEQLKWSGRPEGVEGLSKRSLPKTLRLPTEVSVPWPRSSFDEDFILISEFSENEGPRPVQTIPSDGGGTFDKNAFSVHVMSVDYQAQGRNAAFSVAEDTQLFLTEKKEKVYAYVHHFTLYDIHARGFVRPFCMCYLSHCKRKVLSCMEQLMAEFTKVSRLFRFGNRIVFSRDLQQRLIDLETLRAEKPKMERPLNIHDIQQSMTDKTKEHYEQVWQETKKIIQALKPHMNDPRIMQQFKELESLAEGRGRSFTIAGTGMKDLPKDTSFLSTVHRSHEPKLRRACSLTELDELEKRRVKEEASCKVFSPAYLHNIKQLRNLHDLCEWGAKEGLNRLRSILKFFTQDAIALAIEKTEAELIDPSESLLTVGRSVVSNFLHNVDMKCRHTGTRPCVYQPQLSALSRKLSLGSSGSCYSIDSFKSCLEDDVTGSVRSSDGILSPFIPSVLFHKDLHGKDNWEPEYERWDSDTTSGSPSSEAYMRSEGSTADNLSFNEFCIIDENTAIQRQFSEIEVCHHRLPINPLTRKSYSLESLPSMRRGGSQPRDIELRGTPSLIPFLARMHANEGPLSSGAPRERATDVKDGEPSEPREEKPAVLSPKYSRATKGEDTCLKKSHMPRLEKVPFRCYAEEVCHPIETSPVISRVLDFKNNFSFGIHLAFALLSGRPVIIMAESYNERDVRHLVSALWTFIPENTSHGRVVFPWRRKPLHITDLPSLKLAGLCKNRHSNMLPKSVKRYVSVMDFETGCIITPPYKGMVLCTIFNHRNSWPTNTSLVAFIHSVFLELASKAYVYYYAYCLGGLQMCSYKGRPPYKQSTYFKPPNDDIEVLSRLGVHFSDAKIVQYLSEVVKQQQIDYHLLNEQEPRPPTINADLCQCKQFRNLPPLDPIQ